MRPADRLLVAFIALSITAGIAGGVMQLLLPLYAISLQVSAAGVGMIRGVAQFGGLTTSLPGGFLIDRFGARRVYTVSCLLDAALIVLIPSAPTLSLLTGCLFLEGALGTLRWTTVNSAFFSSLNSIGHARAGWTRASLAMGANFMGPLLGGLLAGRVGFRASYALVAAVVAAPALVMPFWTSNGISSRTATPREETLLDQFRGLMGNRLLWRVALLQGAAISCNSAFLVYIVLLVVDTLAGTPRLASMLIAAQGGAFVAIMLCGGRLLDRCRLRGLYAAAFLAQAAGLLMCGTLTTGWLLGTGAVAFGLGTGLVTTISFSRLGKMTGEKGKLAGLFFLVTGTGVALGPIWGGLLVQMWGVRAAFTGFVPVVLAALLAVTLPVREAAVVAGEQAVPS